jgi:hypothetical protein
MARGYLPKELPFLFSTGQLATVIHAAYLTLGAKKGLLTKPLTIPIAAKGGMRRISVALESRRDGLLAFTVWMFPRRSM